MMVNNFKSFLKNTDNYRYLICIAAFVLMIIESINYVNGGVEYDHLTSFRPFCAAFAVALLALMDRKAWFNIFNLIYIPICYGVTHFLYENLDFMNKFDIYAPYYPDVKRYAKLVILLYGILIISVLVDIFKNKGFERLKKVSPLMLIVWVVYAVALIIFHNEYQYNWFILIGITVAIYVFSNDKSREIFINSLKYGFLISFAFVVYKSMRHRPYDTERYMSYFVNSNVCGTYFACVNVVIYTKICEWWSKEKSKLRVFALIAYLFTLGVSGTMTIFNYTRTTLTATIVSFILLLVLRILRKEFNKDTLARIGAMIGAIVILFYPTYLAMRYIPALFNEPTFMAWEYDEIYRVHKDDPFDSPKYTSIQEFLTLALGKWGIYVDFEADQKEDGEAVVIDTERDVTNGRKDIWKAFTGLIGPVGHYPAYIYIGHEAQYENAGLHINVTYDEQAEADIDNLVYHAHDTYLHVAYIHGIIFAVLYIAMCGIVFVVSIINVIKAKDDVTQHVFAMLIICISLFSQITESIVHPAYILCSMMYFSIAYVVTSRKNIEEKSEG